MTVSQDGHLGDKTRSYKEMVALNLRLVVISEGREGL